VTTNALRTRIQKPHHNHHTQKTLKILHNQLTIHLSSPSPSIHNTFKLAATYLTIELRSHRGAGCGEETHRRSRTRRRKAKRERRRKSNAQSRPLPAHGKQVLRDKETRILRKNGSHMREIHGNTKESKKERVNQSL